MNRRADIIGGLAATAVACWLTGLAAESGALAYAAAALAVCAVLLALHAASQTAAMIRYHIPPDSPRARMKARVHPLALWIAGGLAAFTAVVWWVVS